MGYFCEISKYFRVLVIQSFLALWLNFGEFTNFLSGIWDSFQNIKTVIWNTKDLLPGPQIQINMRKHILLG